MDIKEWFENKFIDLQEEMTTKWSSKSERELAENKYVMLEELKNELEKEGLL